MVLMILAISSLEALMTSMAEDMAWISSAPRSPAARACRANSLVLLALSPFCLVMLDNSSSEALLSSRAAACSLAPSAMIRLLEAISSELSLMRSAPCFRWSMILCSGTVMRRPTVSQARTMNKTAMATVLRQAIVTLVC